MLIRDFPAPLKALALERALKYEDRKARRGITPRFSIEDIENGDVGEGFVWIATPEGHDFWLRIYEARTLQDLENVLYDHNIYTSKEIYTIF